MDLKRSMSKFRFDHSIRVAEEARKLARCYHFDEEKAYVAGLVHDIAKEFTLEENQKWIEKYKLSSDFFDVRHRVVLHGEIGAIVAKERYGLEDDICNAIRYHTVGHVSMSLLEKIVFVADKIEPGKDYVRIDEERELAYQEIDKSLLLCLLNQKEEKECCGKVMHPNAIELIKSLEVCVK